MWIPKSLLPLSQDWGVLSCSALFSWQLLCLPSLGSTFKAPFHAPLGDKGSFLSLPCLGHLMLSSVWCHRSLHQTLCAVGWSLPIGSEGLQEVKDKFTCPGNQLASPTLLPVLLIGPAVHLSLISALFISRFS